MTFHNVFLTKFFLYIVAYLLSFKGDKDFFLIHFMISIILGNKLGSSGARITLTGIPNPPVIMDRIQQVGHTNCIVLCYDIQ